MSMSWIRLAFGLAALVAGASAWAVTSVQDSSPRPPVSTLVPATPAQAPGKAAEPSSRAKAAAAAASAASAARARKTR